MINKHYKPLFPRVEEKDYHAPIKMMKHYYSPKLYRNLLTTKIYSGVYRIHNAYADELIMRYISCRPKCYIITCWPNACDSDVKSLADELSKSGIVHYIKMIELTEKQLTSLIYQLYIDTKRFTGKDAIKKIKEKTEFVKCLLSESDTVFRIHAVVFENVKDLKLSGSMAPYKQELRGMMSAKCAKVKNDSGQLRGDDFIHINDHFCQTIEYAKMYFNKRSIQALEHQDPAKFIKLEHNHFLQLQYSLLRKVSLYYQEQFIFDIGPYTTGLSSLKPKGVCSTRVKDKFSKVVEHLRLDPSAEDFSDFKEFFYFLGLKVRWSSIKKPKEKKEDTSITVQEGGWLIPKHAEVSSEEDIIRVMVQGKDGPSQHNPDIVVSDKEVSDSNMYIQIHNPLSSVYCKILPNSSKTVFSGKNVCGNTVNFGNFSLWAGNSSLHENKELVDKKTDRVIQYQTDTQELQVKGMKLIRQVPVETGVVLDFQLEE